MKLVDFVFEAGSNVSFANAIRRIRDGYQHGLDVTRNTCYDHLGNWLKNNPELAKQAKIRFWGLHKTASGNELIVHADAVLPDGRIFSTVSPDEYGKRQAEIVHEFSYPEWYDLIIS